ncbi:MULTISPECIES: TIGR00730 family Rossman fold protein [unclassified Leeuwenhoekiella]|uniref:LOG family protein n=1 Tax=unclassified Leeuwenhoekiella TaxID=2615029 RepID=UPI000C3B096C|nr:MULTISPECIES: TIGR00730 family Rossman fold protein [unclassified Leeuwenhoekiella]MAW94624.1 TIGR00730 family Rossman fold protein [Leeuwenhoekiella sp.]MBA82047.1 TIGR00730 family Rossman fold protein [Leeuwenhoekiella sp.]|tara:strand:- start:10031 stop:10624 length:594 start_codon:yes stop_codon:yes gene_type:complete
MSQEISRICVFCGSSDGNDPKIIEEANHLGKVFAERNITVVYGGSQLGIMGAVAKSCLEAGGKAVGIIPEFLKTKEIVHTGLDELITTQTMHERKLKMQEVSDGFITLPGGFGTFEELFEIITWSQLGLHHKPIGLLNTNGFYNALIEMLDEMVKRGFLKQENRDLLIVNTDIKRLLDAMEQFEPDLQSKFLKPENT